VSAPRESPLDEAWIDSAVREAMVEEAQALASALLRRVPVGLPRIDRLTDVNNAVSVLHVMPIGGEDQAA
jgi:DNA/RNA-binding domain of Phe-tRNA-synthetase-like protein